MKKLFLSESNDLLAQYNALQKLNIMLRSKAYDYKVIVPSRDKSEEEFLFEDLCEHQCLSLVAKMTNMKKSLYGAAAVLMTGKHDIVELIKETFKEENAGYSLEDFIADANLRYIQIEDELNLMKIEEAMRIIRMNIPEEIMKQKEHLSIDTANKILALVNITTISDQLLKDDFNCLIQSTIEKDYVEKPTDSEQK